MIPEFCRFPEIGSISATTLSICMGFLGTCPKAREFHGLPYGLPKGPVGDPTLILAERSQFWQTPYARFYAATPRAGLNPK